MHDDEPRLEMPCDYQMVGFTDNNEGKIKRIKHDGNKIYSPKYISKVYLRCVGVSCSNVAKRRQLVQLSMLRNSDFQWSPGGQPLDCQNSHKIE